MRNHFPLSEKRLENHFTDEKPLYSDLEALLEANRCLFCYDAPCVQACPADVDVPVFIQKIKSGNLRGAAKTIFSTNLLGVSTSRVCPVEESCAGACVLNEQNGKPVNIGRLQRYATEKGLAEAGRQRRPLFTSGPSLNKKVALIGAGPASLACAGTLALGGVTPVIFEKGRLPGGLNTTGIAPYKIDTESALLEIEWLLDLGIELKTGRHIGVDLPFAGLLTDFEAVFLGVGLGKDKFPGIPGETETGVWGATDLIRKIKNEADFTIPASMTKALVVGGGNTAIDIARELAMLGMPEVDIIYRRTEAEMPGYPHELRKAKQYGVRMLENLVTREIRKSDTGRLVLAVDHKLSGEKTDLEADWIVFAIGQASHVAKLNPRLKTDDRGRVSVNPETMETSVSGVYAGGDCVNGGKEVVNAVADGRRAALQILKKISSET
ncbi:MAG: FAD-dependent oxidoreductase [FCB group bacterium]|nr:FAD-dependent oxidoreductase [FCB group bacterium]